MSSIPLSRRVGAYAYGVYPEWDPGMLDDELISRGLHHRTSIHRRYSELSSEQKELVHATDVVMIEHAPEIAEWCDIDDRWGEREEYRESWGITRDLWWWWLDDIALGRYPLELLPDYLREAAAKYRSQS